MENIADHWCQKIVLLAERKKGRKKKGKKEKKEKERKKKRREEKE